jgi:hypothetical protein
VAEQHDQVRPRPDGRQERPERRDRIEEREPAEVPLGLVEGEVAERQADDRDAPAGAPEDPVRPRSLRRQAGRVGAHDPAAQRRRLGAKRRDAAVEVVVAERDRVDAEPPQQRRRDRAGGRAEVDVAGVQQEVAAAGRAQAPDQAGQAPSAVGCRLARVVDVDDRQGASHDRSIGPGAPRPRSGAGSAWTAAAAYAPRRAVGSGRAAVVGHPTGRVPPAD